MKFIKTIHSLVYVFLHQKMMERTEIPFQVIFESVVEGVILSDKGGIIIMANSAAEALFGYAEGGLTGLTIETLVPKKNQTSHKIKRKTFTKNPSPRNMGMGRDLVGLKKDGSLLPIEISLSNTVINDEPVVIAFIIDITGRKKIEEALQKEKETAGMYLEIAGAFIMVLDNTGNIQMINQKGCYLLEDKEKNILGKNWFDHFIPNKGREQKRKVFNHIINNKHEKRSFEDIIISKSGALKIIDWDFVLIPTSVDQNNSLLCSGVDVTSKRKGEKALKKSEEKLIVYATELEKRVSDRTKQLAEAIDKLKTANDELQEEIKVRKKAEKESQVSFEKEKELNELKSRFVSLASHEFRTPLSTILSSVSLIDRYNTKNTEDKRKKHIHRIKNNVNNLTSLLNDFLNLEALEEGKFQTMCESFNIREFMQEVYEETQAITKSNQSILFYPDKKSFGVFLDKRMLKNICYNLLSNAIKYSDPNQEIEFHYARQGKMIEINVIDHGLGIPKSEQTHLFQRFFRAKNVTGIQGSGLGLYIVKKYVKQLNGSINFTSEYQKGSVFTIQLPIRYDKNITD